MKNPIKNALKSFVQNSFSEQELNVMAMGKSDGTISEQVDNRPLPIKRHEVDDFIHAVNALRSSEPTRVLLSPIYDRMMLDEIIQRGIRKRVSRIKQARFKLIDQNAEHLEEQTKLLKKKWYDKYLDKAMISIMRGPELIEFSELKDGEIAKLKLIPELNFNPWKRIITKNQGDMTGWDYTEPPLSPYYIQAGDEDNFGDLLYVAIPFIYRSFVIACWVDYVEKNGVPPRVLKYKSADKRRLRELNDLMKNMISSNYAIIKNDEVMEIFEPKNASGSKDIFDSLIKVLDASIIGLLVGENGTTEGTTSGTFGSLMAMAEVSDDIHRMDQQYIEYLNNDELLPRLKLFGYAIPDGARFEWDNFQDLDAEQTIKAVSDLSQYYEFDHEELAKRTGLPITKIRRLPGEDAGEGGNTQGLGKFKARMRALYGEPKHTGVRIFANYDGDVQRIIRETFNGSIDANQLDAALATAIGDDLNGGAAAAFDFENVAYDSPDNLLASRMRDNLYAFSSAKSFSQMKEMSELLVDAEGRVRSFADFKREAEKVAQIHNVTWLETERNNAVASGQMGAQWNRYEANKDLLPFLEYSTAGDARVRDEHSRLDGTVKPVDDPWWDRNYPPLGHGCRCDVIATSDTSRVTIENPTIDVDPAFQANVGKSGVVYTNAHPYYQVLPQAPTALDAVRNYGMRKVSKILADPKGLKTAKTKAPASGDGFETATDHDLLKVRIDNAVLTESDKSHLAKSVVKSASEVWTNERTTRYLKYYENGAAIVDVDSGMTATGFRWFDLDEADLVDTVRNGILIKRY